MKLTNIYALLILGIAFSIVPANAQSKKTAQKAAAQKLGDAVARSAAPVARAADRTSLAGADRCAPSSHGRRVRCGLGRSREQPVTPASRHTDNSAQAASRITFRLGTGWQKEEKMALKLQ